MSELLYCPAVQIARNEPSIHFDVRLGERYGSVNVDIVAITAMMRGLGMNEAQIASVPILISADAPEENSRHIHGEYQPGDDTIVAYLGSAQAMIDKANETAPYTGWAGARASISSSRTLAHEIKHCADLTLNPDEYKKERARYKNSLYLRAFAKRLEGVMATGYLAAAAEYLAYRPNMFVAGAVGLAAIAASVWPARRSMAAARTRIDASFSIYYNSPWERRARECEDLYTELLGENTAPFLVAAMGSDEINQLMVFRARPRSKTNVT